jgi:protein SCO1/2
VGGSRRLLHRPLPGLLLPLALLLGACGGGGDQQLTGAVLDQPYAVPDTALTDTDGAAYSLAADTDKRLTLVFFGYTHCPDICQVVMATLASAVTRLDDADRDNVDVVFVTTDPERDTATVLRGYLDHIDPDFVGLTGPLADVVSVADGLHIGVEQGEKLPSGGYDITHGTSVLGIDGKDQVPIVWSQETSATQYAADIHQLLS